MKHILSALALTGSLAIPATGQAENITMNLYAIGIKAGSITVNGAEKGNAYALRGLVAPSFLLKLVKEIGFSGSAYGTVRNDQYQSRRYAGNIINGKQRSEVRMHWRGRTPVLDSYKPGREKRSYDINPSRQVGVVDLLTAAYATFKSRRIENLCNATHKMFDGRRRSQISLGAPEVSGKTATCAGKYTRVAGFSPNEMQKRVNFPFVMYYELQDDGMYRFKEFIADATFGKIKAYRR